MTDRQGESSKETQPAPEIPSTDGPDKDANGFFAQEPTPGDPGIPTVESLQQEVEMLAKELAGSQDRLLRTAAEYQNFRRRNTEIRQESMDFGRMTTLEHLLDVYDDLTRTVEAIPEPDAVESGDALESLSQGVRLVQEKFTAQLKKIGLEPIPAVGTLFDENVHEAVMQQPAPEGFEPGQVLIEVQRGYRLGDRILRHAKVVVAGDPAGA